MARRGKSRFDCGIYIITNIVTGNRYIGSSVSTRRRKLDHWNSLKRGDHGNDKLQKNWDKYGEDNFSFKVLLVCEKGDLTANEQGVIDRLRPELNLMTVAGDRWKCPTEVIEKMKKNRGPYVVTEETRKKISATVKNWFTPERRAEMSRQKKEWWTPERKLARSVAYKGTDFRPGTREGKALSEGHRKNVSASIKKWWDNKRKSTGAENGTD